jgi:hypothetical protein
MPMEDLTSSIDVSQLDTLAQLDADHRAIESLSSKATARLDREVEIHARVTADYESRMTAIAVQAAPVRALVRQDLHTIQELYDRREAELEQARAMLQECEFRREIGEATEQVEQSQQAAERAIGECEAAFESVRALRQRYLDVLPDEPPPPPPAPVATPREAVSPVQPAVAQPGVRPAAPVPPVPVSSVPVSSASVSSASVSSAPVSSAPAASASIPAVPAPAAPEAGVAVFVVPVPAVAEPMMAAPAVAPAISEPAAIVPPPLPFPSPAAAPAARAASAAAIAPAPDVVPEPQAPPDAPAEEVFQNTMFMPPPSAEDFKVVETGDTLTDANAFATLAVSAGILIEDRGGLPGSHHRLGPSTSIGRTLDNEVVVPHKEVSRRHARIVMTNGGYVITDLGSPNGTFVNGQRLTNDQRLQDGDKVQMGGREFTYSGPS